MSNNSKILFWVYKTRVNRLGMAPLMLRVTFEKQRMQVSTGRNVQLKQWDSRKSKLKGRNEEAIQINNYITATANRLNTLFSEMVQNGDGNIYDLLNKFLGKDTCTMSLIQLVDFHNEQIQARFMF